MGIAEKGSAKEILAEVPKTLRALVAENTKLASELDEFKKHALAEEIIVAMDEKGLSDPDAPFTEKVASLLASGKDLELVRQAIDLATPHLSLASISSENETVTGEEFVDYLLGG